MTKEIEGKKFVLASSLSLDQWLDYLGLPAMKRPEIEDFRFPTDQMLAEYIGSIDGRSDDEVKALLRHFLAFGGYLGSDSSMMARLAGRDDFDELMARSEYVARLFSSQRHAWEGLSWALDLLPQNPSQAIQVIGAYLTAHIHFLPDGRINGLSDAIALVQAKYLDRITTDNLAKMISHREFEYLIAGMFIREGCQVSVTSATRDGGFDILATREEFGLFEKVLIECKLQTAPICVRAARAVVGVLDAENATKGVLVTSSRFTKPAIDYAKRTARLDLLDGIQLSRRLNGAYGANWPVKVAAHVSEARAKVISGSKGRP